MGDVLKPPGSLLATDRSKAVDLVCLLLNVFGVGVSFSILYSFVYMFINMYAVVDQLSLLEKR